MTAVQTSSLLPSFFLAGLAALALLGCDDGATVLRPDAGDTVVPTATYWDDVAPLVQRECLSCHIEGGVGPFPLTTYDEVRGAGPEVVAAVTAGVMPPWMPAADCHELADAKGLSEDERGVFQRWLDQGMIEGTPRTLPELPGPPAFEPTHFARMAEPYTPDLARPDDYRCFVLDLPIDDEVFVTGRRVLPGADALVHHVLTYAVPPELLDRVLAADTADAGPGYTCFGGPLAAEAGGEASTLALIDLGGWVPGATPAVAPAGEAIRIPGGSRIVMQVHYNLLGGETAPDDTELQLTLASAAPTSLSFTSPLAILDLDIPAGAPRSSHTEIFRNYRSTPIALTGMTPHMHLLGTEISLELVPADGSEDQCLVDIPRWDFNWQQSYALPQPEMVPPGAGLRLTCTYDNSPSHQPVVNGEQLEPRDVAWGEGTLDEMCLLYIREVRPFEATAASGCETASTCFDGCTDGDADCLLRCEALARGCRPCALESTIGCARDACRDELAVPFLSGCLQTCITSWAILGGSFEACMLGECGETNGQAALDCVDAHVGGGACDAELAACGISR